MFAALALAIAVSAPAASPEATASPAAPRPLRVIEHIHALTPFCRAFEAHFNGAARPMVEADANVGSIGFTLGTIETHFHALGGENLIYDDRVSMMHYLDTLQKLLPEAQREINALRDSAKLTPDPDDAQAALDLASALQDALDKQRQMTTDSLGVVQALTEFTLSPIDPGAPVNPVNPFGRFTDLDPMHQLGPINNAYPRASTELVTRREVEDAQLTLPKARRDVRYYMKWDKQLDHIANAESSAATTADVLTAHCT